eukprot:scaffold33924_cov60-Phaeocystis_antarctica.AAC.6
MGSGAAVVRSFNTSSRPIAALPYFSSLSFRRRPLMPPPSRSSLWSGGLCALWSSRGAPSSWYVTDESHHPRYLPRLRRIGPAR